jgi:type IV pilus assembly protein PilE
MKAKGFTIIELLVAMAIFAIISAIAIPLYTQYTQRGYRTELMSDLLVCAQGLERFNAVNFTYIGANPGGDDTALDVAICNPASVQQARYAITAVTTRNTYDLTATPSGSMAGTGVLTFDEAGTRTWDEDSDGIDAHDNDWEEG